MARKSLTLILACAPLWARADTLPYSTRTNGYSGWNTTVSGDVRTVGMAGATVGLPDTFLSATDNPAGLAMLLQDADDNFVHNTISDSHVQNSAYPITTGSLGVAVNAYPWGFSAGYVTTSSEGQPYSLPGVPGEPNVTVSTREFEFAVARIFWNNRFSLGASVNIGEGEEQIDPFGSATSEAIGATLGAMVRLPNHWVAGVSYTLPMLYPFTDPSGNRPAPVLPGFYQPISAPGRFGVGSGWIPNRFVRFSMGLYFIGTTPGAALLSNDQTLVGSSFTMQPRAGAAYTFADYKELQGTVFAGNYLEMTRIEGTPTRVHMTAGIEIHPWIFTVGAAMDLAQGYSNYITGVGIDIFKGLEKLDIIPTPYSPPRKGPLPSPQHIQDEGLPRPLVKKWKKKGPDMNPIKVIKQVPARAEKKFNEMKKMILNPEAEDDDSGD